MHLYKFDCNLKIFSDFKMEVCTLYGLSHGPRDLFSYLMDELNGRTALTPVDLGPEAHKSTYTPHIMAKPFDLKFWWKEGSKAKGSVDYSVELTDAKPGGLQR